MKYRDRYAGLSIDEKRHLKDGKGKHIRDEWGNLVGIHRPGLPTEAECEEYMEKKAEEDLLLRSVFNSKRFHEGGSRKRSHFYKSESTELIEEFHQYYSFLKYCVESADPDGLFLEFGVHKGGSIKAISKWCSQIYGFDSWKGYEGEWSRTETDSVSGAAWKLSDKEVLQLKKEVGSNVKLVSGWYESSLPKFLDKVEGFCSLVHCDSDTYQSTKEVLDMLTSAGRITEGTIIIFDDFYGYPKYKEHEYKAFNDYVKNRGLIFEWVAHTSGRCPWNGGQVALRVVELPSEDSEE